MWELYIRCIVVAHLAVGLLIGLQWPEGISYGSLSCLCSTMAIHNYLMSPSLSLKPHWRTLPLFSINFIISVSYLWNYSGRGLWFEYHLAGWILSLVALTTGVLIALVPVPSPTGLTGCYKRIGTHSFHIPITLPEGSQLYKGQTSYELFAQCWFPLSTKPPTFLQQLYYSIVYSPHSVIWSSGHPLHQTQECLDLMEQTASDSKLPSFLFSHISLARTNSEHIQDIHKVDFQSILAEQPDKRTTRGFPIAIYSHGMYSWRQLSSSICEKLASNGYIVYAVDHLPSAMMARPYNSPADSIVYDYLLPESIKPGSRDERMYYMGGMDRRAKEVITLIDHLSRPEISKEYAIDMKQVNLFGHSFGGGTCATVACRDKRVTSCVLLDSWMYPVPDADRVAGLKCPTLMVSSELWAFSKYQALFRKDLVERSSDVTVFNATVKGSDHLNFCDLHYMAHPELLRLITSFGTVDAYLHSEAKAQLVLRFFTAMSVGKSLLHTPGNDVQRLFKLCAFEFDDSSDSANDDMDAHGSIHGRITEKMFETLTELEQVSPRLVEFMTGNLVNESALSQSYDDEVYRSIVRILNDNGHRD